MGLGVDGSELPQLHMYKRKPQSASVLISLRFIALLPSVAHSKYSDTGDLQRSAWTRYV